MRMDDTKKNPNNNNNIVVTVAVVVECVFIAIKTRYIFILNRIIEWCDMKCSLYSDFNNSHKLHAFAAFH